jgi:hypothetical protein
MPILQNVQRAKLLPLQRGVVRRKLLPGRKRYFQKRPPQQQLE